MNPRLVLNLLMIALITLAIAGCGRAKYPEGARNAEQGLARPDLSSSPEITVLSDASHKYTREASASMLPEGGGAGAGPGDPARADPANALIARKMVYTADVRLVVEDLDAATTQVKELFKTYQTQIASEDAAGTKGSSRRTSWKVRVPVERFEEFLAAVTHLGELENSTTKSQDVTDEFYDLEARIKQKLVEEQSLLKLQEEAVAIMNKDPKARMEDVLAVRREWNNVRQEIERMQGRVKLLASLADLTTVTITINERRGYVPPTSPTFGTTIDRTFDASLGSLVTLGKGIVLFFVALTPWLPVVAIVVGLGWFLIRRARRSARPQAMHS